MTGAAFAPRTMPTLATAAVAGVWLDQGLFAKVLRLDRWQEAVVAATPLVGGRRARPVTIALGIVETALGLWALSRRRPIIAAAVQTATLVAIDGGALTFARRFLAHPVRLVARNGLFLLIVWGAARREARR